MEIRDFPTLVNKCRLVEDCNRKLVAAKSIGSNFKKRLALQGLKFKLNFQQQKKFQPMDNKGKHPQRPFMKQTCTLCGKNHGDRLCLVGQNVCFGCDKASHKIYECPAKSP